MGIMMVTSLSSYTKNMEMAMRWQKRQEEDFTPDNTGSADDAFQKQVDELRYPQHDRSYQMESDIEIKMTAGKKLSGEEMQYLKKHNLATYHKAKIIERERAAYEKELEACKTKDEVEKLKADRAAAAVDRLNAIRNNSSLSLEKKREMIQMEHFKGASLDDAMHEFIESSRYKHLPEEPRTSNSEGDMEKSENPGLKPNNELFPDIEPIEVTKQGEAAEYEMTEKEMAPEEKTFTPQQPADDACEEGSIMKAILDEEARWAREDEENAANPQEADPAQAKATLEILPVKQAQNAYLAAQAYAPDAQTSRINVRR